MVIQHGQHEGEEDILAKPLIPNRAQLTLFTSHIAKIRGFIVYPGQPMELLSSRIQEELAMQDERESARHSVNPYVFATVLHRKEYRPLKSGTRRIIPT